MANDLKSQFLLDPEITFLNHGSFGACPRPVFETYQRWQRELERRPVEFLGRRAGVNEHTKVIFLSHITSLTALIFPAAEVCARARQAGLQSVVDGAHAPCQISGLNLSALNADVYEGACHKLVTRWNDTFLIRVSLQGYNSREDADVLLAALGRLLPRGDQVGG